MIRRLCILLLILSLPSLAAVELYVRNRPFSGAVTGSGNDLWVELVPFAKAMQAELVQNDSGGYALGKLAPDTLAAVPAGRVAIGDGTVELRQRDGLSLVPLQEAAGLLGARVSHNKDLGTIDVNLAVEGHAVSAGDWDQSPKVEKAATPPPSAPAAKVLRLHGKIGLPGADAVGLFESGSATVPYKTGKVDKKGNYTLDIDLDKDMHAFQDGVNITDVRFYKAGDFESLHGRCNFIYHLTDKNALFLEPYGTNQRLEIPSLNYEFTESY